MKKTSAHILLLFLGFNTFSANAQRLDSWRAYFNSTRAIDVDKIGSNVYVASENSIAIYNTADNSLKTVSTISGLSDVGITLIRANPNAPELFVGYSNGNLDIIKGNSISNFSAIKNTQASGNKSIEDIHFYDNTAYISTSFGILEFDVERREVRDTYAISGVGNIAVNQTTVLNDTLFAATDQGLYYGSLQQDLTIFSNWEQDISMPDSLVPIPHCASQNGFLYINHQNAVSPGLYIRSSSGWTNVNGTPFISDLRSTIGGLTFCLGFYWEVKDADGTSRKYGTGDYNGVDVFARSVLALENGDVYIADNNLGLVRAYPDGQFEFIAPDGPASNRVFDLDFANNKLWVATGAPVRPGNWDNQYILAGFYSYDGASWVNYTPGTHPILLDKLFFDVPKIYADPDNPDLVYVGSFFSGFLLAGNNEIKNIYTDVNTSLGNWPPGRSDGLNWVGVAGFAKDADNNLWITNCRAESPLSVLKPDSTWKNYSLAGSEGLESNKVVLDMLIDQQGQKWIILNKGGVVVFDDNGTIDDESDDKVRVMTTQSGGGDLPSNEVLSIKEDLDGEIWVGTLDGIAVFYSPFDALQENFSGARQILVEQDGVFQFLLEGQSISAIAIDGANRKWIGTFSAGVFLLSEDGTQQIKRFTAENSPLPSNRINDIVISPSSGEVFFGTDEGIVSYISDATTGAFVNSCTTVYPNPVSENYTGDISISGLLRDSEVRITDVRGNLIYSTKSNGGKATWNGKNINGYRVATGVYFALSADVEGASTCVSKILVVK